MSGIKAVGVVVDNGHGIRFIALLIGILLLLPPCCSAECMLVLWLLCIVCCFFFCVTKQRAGVVSTKLYRRVGFSQSGANLASVGVLERENR